MANATITIQVIDSVQSTTPAAVSIFVNGKKTGNSVILPIGSLVIIEAEANGYQAGSQSFTLTGDQNITIPLTPATNHLSITLQFIPSTTVSWGLGGPQAFTGTTGADGLSVLPDVPAGTYTVTGTAAGYTTLTQTLEVSYPQNFTLQLTTDPGSASKSGPVGANPAAVAPLADPSSFQLPQDNIEHIYDNSAFQGYFTAAQCRLYIGDLFIDELVVLQYARQDNMVPIFGYCSKYVDGYGKGKSIVQGQIVLNYVEQGYLFAAIRNQARAAQEQDPSQQVARSIAKANQAANNPSLDANTRTQAAAQLQQLLKSSSPSDVAAAGKLLKSPGVHDAYDDNPLALEQVFNMQLEIGDGDHKSFRAFEAVILTGNEQVIDARSGEPIGENYTFTARRLR